MILYTDGITERVYEDGTPFDTSGLTEQVRKHTKCDAAEIVERVFEYAHSLEHESDLLEDDSTLLVIKRTG